MFNVTRYTYIYDMMACMSHVELKIVLLSNADIIPLNEKVNFLLEIIFIMEKVIESNDGIN